MTPSNIAKELDWLLRWKTGELAQLKDKGKESDVYKIESKYAYDRNLILLRYGLTYQDASV